MSEPELRVRVDGPDEEGVYDVEIGDPGDARRFVRGFVGRGAVVAPDAADVGIVVPSHQLAVVVGVVEELRAEHDEAGRALATRMLERFLAEAEAREAEAVYLYAEHSDDEFDLVGWYEGHGFARVDPEDQREDPVMVRARSPG
jgi:ribosomal protein S18 acetylase RimI-like enzyme